MSRHKVVCDRLTGSAGRSAGKQGSCNATKIRSSNSAGQSRVEVVHQRHRNAVLSRHPPRPTPDCGPALRPPFDCMSLSVRGTGRDVGIVTEWVSTHVHGRRSREGREGQVPQSLSPRVWSGGLSPQMLSCCKILSTRLLAFHVGKCVFCLYSRTFIVSPAQHSSQINAYAHVEMVEGEADGICKTRAYLGESGSRSASMATNNGYYGW